jgi:hypothetical protein
MMRCYMARSGHNWRQRRRKAVLKDRRRKRDNLPPKFLPKFLGKPAPVSDSPPTNLRKEEAAPIFRQNRPPSAVKKTR